MEAAAGSGLLKTVAQENSTLDCQLLEGSRHSAAHVLSVPSDAFGAHLEAGVVHRPQLLPSLLQGGSSDADEILTGGKSSAKYHTMNGERCGETMHRAELQMKNEMDLLQVLPALLQP